MKQYAIGITNDELGEAAERFRITPSSHNWHRVATAMKAHQFAHFESEPKVEETLVNVARELTVEKLAEAFDIGLDVLHGELLSGRAKLVSIK